MPDNAIYYQVAYAAIAALYGAYALSLVLRRRALRRRRRDAEGTRA